MTDIRGARILLTGASGGLGRAMTRSLAAGGAELVLSGRQQATLEELAGEVGGRVVVADLTRRDDVERLVTDAGPVDILVANAGLPASGDLATFDRVALDRALDVNLRAPILLTHALLPEWRRRGHGHVVLVSSLAGKVAPRGGSVYAATKFGLRGFAAGLRSDLHGSGIPVSVLFPGFVREAGMFADSGAALPPGIGTVTPQAVADALLRALRGNRGEIEVAPWALRAGALLGALFPAVAGTVQARLGAGAAERIARGQRERR